VITDMNNTDRGDFERSWMEVFDEAAIRPSDQVWHQINASLANDEASGYRKRLLFFKLLAAASVVFAIGVGIYSGYMNLGDKGSAPVASETRVLDETPAESEDKFIPLVADSESEDEITKPEIEVPEINDPILIAEDKTDQELVQLPVVESPEMQDIDMLASAEWEPGFTEPGVRKYITYKQDYLYMEPEEVIEQKDPVLWAGVNFSAGVFNPNVEYGASSKNFSPFGFLGGMSDEAAFDAVPPSGQDDNMMATDMDRESVYSPTINQRDYQADQARAYSVNLGYRMGKRWILESGLGYSYNKSATSSNSYLSDPLSQSKVPDLYADVYGTAELNQVNYVSEGYKIYNTFEYVTVPIDVGYLLVNRRINVILKTGMSSNIFIQNTIGNQDIGFDDIKVDKSEDIPYRSVYLNGKLSTQLTYTLFKRYHLSLEPGYRFALNSMTGSNTEFVSYPSSFMISTGLWYSF